MHPQHVDDRLIGQAAAGVERLLLYDYLGLPVDLERNALEILISFELKLWRL
jgi:hypothetical protein